MKKVLVLVSAIVAAAFLTGCSYPNMFGPLFSDATLPITATSNSKGSKTGTAKSTNIIGIHTGDSSIQAAAKSAGISKIYTVDVHGKCILGVYSETTVIVTGE